MFYVSSSQKPKKEAYDKFFGDITDALKPLNDVCSKGNSHLCGDQITVADIVIFTELSMTFEICGLTTESAEVKQHRFLVNWLKVMKTDVIIDRLDNVMKEKLRAATKAKLTS